MNIIHFQLLCLEFPKANNLKSLQLKSDEAHNGPGEELAEALVRCPRLRTLDLWDLTFSRLVDFTHFEGMIDCFGAIGRALSTSPPTRRFSMSLSFYRFEMLQKWTAFGYFEWFVDSLKAQSPKRGFRFLTDLRVGLEYSEYAADYYEKALGIFFACFPRLYRCQFWVDIGTAEDFESEEAVARTIMRIGEKFLERFTDSSGEKRQLEITVGFHYQRLSARIKPKVL